MTESSGTFASDGRLETGLFGLGTGRDGGKFERGWDRANGKARVHDVVDERSE